MQHLLAAQCTWVKRRPLYITYVTRDRASGDCIRIGSECDRLSDLDPSNSVVAELAVTVEAAINHYVKGVTNSCS